MAAGYVPINSTVKLQQALQMLNRYLQDADAARTTKVDKQAGRVIKMSGRLPNGKYGDLWYSSDGTPCALIGQHPVDGDFVLAVAVAGVNVLEALENSPNNKALYVFNTRLL